MRGQETNEIKRLRERAEISRHIHGELVRKKRWQGRLLYASVQIIGVMVAVAGSAYFRVTGGGTGGASVFSEILLWMMMVLPPVGTALIILDATIFRLRDQEETHKDAVKIWGDWIRRASETMEEENPNHEDRNRATRKIEKAYRKCMESTPSIPVSKKQFLKYKSDYIDKKNKSIKLDQEKEWESGQR